MPKDVRCPCFIFRQGDDTLFIVVLDKYHWMLYFLVTAMYPRFLITLDEDLNNIPVTVRVGQVSISERHIHRHLPSYLGCRCSRSSWQTENNIWIPNTSNTCPAGYD